MAESARKRGTGLRGLSRIAISAITGITSLVETIHASIAKRPTQLAGPIVGGAIEATTVAVYGGIRIATRALGASLDRAMDALEPALRELDALPVREALVAALNGVLGDRLAAAGNPLAISMSLRRGGNPLTLTREGLTAGIAAPSAKVVLLIHGLCMNDLRWERDGHDHGAALERDLGLTAVYLRYNSGLHISTNGRELAKLLDVLLAAWPVRIAELSIVAHSMGGLVARSACHYASMSGYGWLGKLDKLVFLGTPHHGVPLERIGHWLQLVWDKTPFTAPFARLGRLRSAGITDLRHGFLLDEHWEGRDRFAKDSGRCLPVALPDGVRCFAIAAAIGGAQAPVRVAWLGDGLVPVPSALGTHREPRFTLAIPASQRWTAYGAHHLDLLSRRDIYERIRAWLSGPAADPRLSSFCNDGKLDSPR